jgi:hypothetical protein
MSHREEEGQKNGPKSVTYFFYIFISFYCIWTSITLKHFGSVNETKARQLGLKLV